MQSLAPDECVIVAEAGNGTSDEDWCVRAYWHGCIRIVFMGDAFECACWARTAGLTVVLP